MSVVGQPIEQGRRELLVAKDLDPFAEGQVGRDESRAALIALARQIEEQFTASRLNGTKPNSSTISSGTRWYLRCNRPSV